MSTGVRLSRQTGLFLLAVIFLIGLGLRLWALGDKGLAYDEAATALMARAAPAEIIQFHWDAAFEHPPLWQLTMHLWSRWLGQHEAVLRLLPALAGALAIPLTWLWLRSLWPQRGWLHLLAAALVATSPVLVYYSQEARMYSLVLLLALLSLLATAGLVKRPRLATATAFILANWLMVGYHYYALLLVGAEALFLILVALRRPNQQRGAWVWAGAVVVSVMPIALWMAFAPGFHETVAIVFGGIGKGGPGAGVFLDGLWRDLSFGGIRWQPEYAVGGYLLLPLIGIGLATLLRTDGSGTHATPWSWLVVLVFLLPLMVSTALFRSLAARYILFVTPALYTLAAAGILWLWRRHTLLGVTGLLLAAVVAASGLAYYFGPYHKSEYREMAAFLRAHRGPADGVMLYAPRQHLLAKYYLPPDWTFYTAPTIDLPPYWPVTAPRVVPEEMDGQIQDDLRQHPALWLVATAEGEVDPGEFVPKYLTAVAYKEDCWNWLDVQLCRFASPDFVAANETAAPDVLFNHELRLVKTAVKLMNDADLDRSYLLAQLDWLAEQKPTLDYRVTLRLMDAAGHVVAQRDEFPIGALLPPTTWNAGDAKPGYMALPIPDGLAPGRYDLTAGLYDPTTGAQMGNMTTIASVEWPPAP